MTRDSASRLRRASSSATSIWRRSSAAFSSMNLWGTPLGFSVALTRRSHNSCGEDRSIGEREGKVDQRTNRDARRAVGEVRRKRSTGNNNARRAHLHESRRVLLQECQELAVDGCSALVHLLLLEEIVNHRYQHVVLDGQQLGDARRDPRFDNLPFDARHVHAPVKLGRVLQGSLLDVDAADDAAAAERLTCLGHPGSCREHALGDARWSARGTGPGQVKYGGLEGWRKTNSSFCAQKCQTASSYRESGSLRVRSAVVAKLNSRRRCGARQPVSPPRAPPECHIETRRRRVRIRYRVERPHRRTCDGRGSSRDAEACTRRAEFSTPSEVPAQIREHTGRDERPPLGVRGDRGGASAYFGSLVRASRFSRAFAIAGPSDRPVSGPRFSTSSQP